jgi:hypothetical protein
MKCLECNKEFELTSQKVLYAGKIIAGVLMAGYKARNTWKDPSKGFFDAPTNRELI